MTAPPRALAVFPRTTLVVWLLVLVVAGWVVSQARFTADLAAFLPASASEEEQVLVDQLKDGVAARLVLVAFEGAPPEALAGVSRTVAEALARDARFRFVANGASTTLEADQAALLEYRYLLSPTVTPERFTAAGLRTALETGLQLLASPAGSMVARTLPRDPTGESLQILLALAGNAQPESREGVWFSPDGRRALAIAETVAPGYDTEAQAAAADAIRAAFAAAAPPAGARLVLSGPSVFAAEARASIEGDAWRLSLIATVLVTVLLLVAYRSPVLALAGILPIGTGMLVGIAAVDLGFGFVHGITLGFGATLIGEAADYPTYLLTHQKPGESTAHALGRVWPTLRLAILTTVFSGLTMLLSSFQGLAQLGLLLVVGIATAGLVTRWVIPVLGLGSYGLARREALPAAIDPERLAHAPRWIGWIAALATIVAALWLFQHRDALWDDDLEALSPIPEAAKNLDGELRAELGAPDVRFMVFVRGASREAVLEGSEALAPTLARLVESGTMRGFDMAAQLLPSERTQAARRAALPDTATLERALAEASAGLPFKPGTFAPFLADVARTRAGLALAPAALDGTAAALKVRSLLVERDGRWTALVPLHAVNDGAALREAIAPALAAVNGATARLLDLKAASNALVAGYRGESLRLTAFGFLAIVAVLILGLRDWRPLAHVLAPVIAALVLDVAILAALGLRLSIFHLVALLLVAGAGLNYALFFNRPEPDPRERKRTALALVVVMLTSVFAFGALATSAMPVLRAIGLTVGLGVVLSFLTAGLFARRASAPPAAAV